MYLLTYNLLTPFVWFFLVKCYFERNSWRCQWVLKSTIFCEMIVCVELTHKIKGENVAYILTQMVGNFFFILTHWMRLKCGKKSDLKIPFRYMLNLTCDGCNCTLTIYFPCRSNTNDAMGTSSFWRHVCIISQQYEFTKYSIDFQ